MSLVETAAFTLSAYIGYKVLGAVDVGKKLSLSIFGNGSNAFPSMVPF